MNNVHVCTTRISDPHKVLNSKYLKILGFSSRVSGVTLYAANSSTVKNDRKMPCVKIHQNSRILSLVLSHTTFDIPPLYLSVPTKVSESVPCLAASRSGR